MIVYSSSLTTRFFLCVCVWVRPFISAKDVEEASEDLSLFDANEEKGGEKRAGRITVSKAEFPPLTRLQMLTIFTMQREKEEERGLGLGKREHNEEEKREKNVESIVTNRRNEKCNGA